MRNALLSPLRGWSGLGGSDLQADARSHMLPPHSRLMKRSFKAGTSASHEILNDTSATSGSLPFQSS